MVTASDELAGTYWDPLRRLARSRSVPPLLGTSPNARVELSAGDPAPAIRRSKNQGRGGDGVIASEKLLVGPGFASRYQAWKLLICPATIATLPVGGAAFLLGEDGWDWTVRCDGRPPHRSPG